MCGRPYADLLNDVLVNLKEQTSEEDHPLLKENQGEKELVILVSTDKGLCGGLNTNLFLFQFLHTLFVVFQHQKYFFLLILYICPLGLKFMYTLL